MKTYITTPIYYVNGNPHVGHAHTSVMGDILKREFLMKGNEVYFTTGVDEHGQKNEASIKASGLSKMEYLDRQSRMFSELFDKLNVSYDKFVRTTVEDHMNAVRFVLQKVYDKGLIIKKEYEGLYCIGCEMFKTNADLDENGMCVDHQTKPVLMKESNYFFKLSAYQDWLIEFVNQHPDWIQPEHYRNEVLHLLDEPLPDLCISRPKSRCSLGIELPFDSDYVTYVWFDALVNYISSLGYPDETDRMKEFWGNSTHLMAKDIIKTHCIYWPIMLKAIDLEPQSRNLVHGYWTGEGGIKMSKSIGNVVNPDDVIEEFGVDAFRYFLARTMGEGESSMSMNLIKGCYNTELVNTLSNAVYRTMKLANKIYKGQYPCVEKFREEDEDFLNKFADSVQVCCDKEPSLLEINEHARAVYELGKAINGYFDKSAPWTLAQMEDLSQFDSCILTCVEAMRLLGELVYPIMPETSNAIISSLGFSTDWHEGYSMKKRVIDGTQVFKTPQMLFQRKE